MKNKVSVVKKIAFLMMTMALAVAFVACQAAAPGKAGEPGAPGSPGQPGEPAPRLPYLNTGFADVELAATGVMNTMSITLAGHFVDPHEEALTYSASSEPSDVVETSVSGSTLTLTAMKEGTATVTVGAENKDGASAFNPGAQFTVTVMETVAPMVTEGGIPEQTLYKDDSPVALTLTKADADSMGYFTHDSAITYDVSSSPVGFVTAVEAEGVLTLTPLVTGQTIVTVVATAESRNTDPVAFTVTVMAGSAPPEPEPPEPPKPEPPEPPKPEPPEPPKPEPPEPPKPENVAPTASTIPAVEMMTGDDPLDKDLSMYFSDADGDELTFSNPTSTDTAVATVTSEGSTLTITAVEAGTSTLSLTATDPDGLSATGSLELTVSAPSSSIPTTLDLSVGDVVAPRTHELQLPDGYSLQTADSSKVNAVRTGATGEGNQWRLTARAKTTTPPSVTVYVNDGNNDEHQQIAVTVLNSPPLRNDEDASLALLDLGMADIMFEQTGEYSDGALYDPAIEQRILYRTGTDSTGNGLGVLSRFYTDADGDPLSFSIEVRTPHVGLILFKSNSDGFLFTMTDTADTPGSPVHVVYADILTERIDRPIGLDISANDGEATSEEAVYFELRNEKPIPRDDGQVDPSTVDAAHAGNPAYLLTQLQEPGFFREESYGNRTGVDHIFKFGHSTKMVGSNAVLGFTFAHDFLEKLVEDGFSIGIEAGGSVGADDHRFSVGGTVSDIAPEGKVRLGEYPATVLGSIYYDVEVSGPITQSGADEATIANFVQGNVETDPGTPASLEDGVYPEVKFRFNSVGTGTLTITFGVWADRDGIDPIAPGWQAETRRIDFKIIGCTSVGTIKDCP